MKQKIAIIGSGALGSYFGIRLAHAGNEVHFLLRSDYEAVAKNGWSLYLVDGEEIRVNSPHIARTSEEIGSADIVLIGLKTTQNDALPDLLKPLVKRDTLLFTVQNGLGNVEFLKSQYPDNSIVGGLCQIGVNREAPGVIRNFVPKNGFVQLGEAKGKPGDNVERIDNLLQNAGIKTRVTESLGEALWRKLMWNVPYNGLTIAAGGVTTDKIGNDTEWRDIAHDLMEEIRQAAQNHGYVIEPEYTDKLLEFTDQMGPYKPSSLLDYISGRQVEVESIFREPYRQGTETGVPMPNLRFLLKVLEVVTYK